ncbi:hypothetical protein OF83DRAFT_1145011 [Amylostereum chailletii]|nr:hypothetical protein OF83DRAFT_1145011 [Amylostereum chailletii]
MIQLHTSTVHFNLLSAPRHPSSSDTFSCVPPSSPSSHPAHIRRALSGSCVWYPYSLHPRKVCACFLDPASSFSVLRCSSLSLRPINCPKQCHAIRVSCVFSDSPPISGGHGRTVESDSPLPLDVIYRRPAEKERAVPSSIGHFPRHLDPMNKYEQRDWANMIGWIASCKRNFPPPTASNLLCPDSFIYLSISLIVRHALFNLSKGTSHTHSVVAALPDLSLTGLAHRFQFQHLT